MLKSCYFADKKHLNQYRRPVFGATYRAMRFGPVPLEIYEMAKGEPMWLAELGEEQYPWSLEGYRLVPRNADNGPDLNVLSETDAAALREGFAKSRELSFTERTALTHGSDWQAAELDYMRYEDMLEDTPEKEETVAYLREAGRLLRL